MEQSLQEYAMQIADKKLEVTDSIPEDCMLFMSRNAFQKVWSNLIGNAVQYTEQGGQITIAADTDKIWIENSCTPLTEEQLAYIYEPFYRVDDTRRLQGQRTGTLCGAGTAEKKRDSAMYLSLWKMACVSRFSYRQKDCKIIKYPEISSDIKKKIH